MKNLIIAAVGDESLHRYWIGNTAQFHTYLIYYGKHKNKYRDQCDFYHQQEGSKYFIIHDLIKQNYEFFQNYDAVFMPDDDLYMTTKDINRLFQIFHNPPKIHENLRAPNLSLAQPSIMGWYSLWITLHDPKYIYRLTNFVEIMCPVFSKEALSILWPTFTETKSSWGLDMIWDYYLGHPNNRIAIIDDVIALHTRQVKSGDNYKKIDHDPFDDLKYVKEKYNLPIHELTIYQYAKNTDHSQKILDLWKFPDHNI